MTDAQATTERSSSRSRQFPLSRLDAALQAVAPRFVERRAAARMRIQAMQSAYEAAEHTRLRRRYRDQGDGNATTRAGQVTMRDYARHLDRNHDLVHGALNVLVRNVVGHSGIGIEPMPTGADGEVDETTAAQLAEKWKRWQRYPEVTAELNYARSEQLLCRSWMRDGEGFWQYVEGTRRDLVHASGLPFSLELLECDMVPLDYDEPSARVFQSVQVDAWNRPTGYYVYKHHPGSPYFAMPERKRVPTELIGHLKLVDRIGQLRGVSALASTLNRIDDIKDYEESERIAAKIAASMAAVIKKGDPSTYGDKDPITGDRTMRFKPGMIMDVLQEGESIDMINSSRPNPNAYQWRNGQLKMIAAGMDASFSSISRTYEGSYSSQRQELVEQWGAYALLSHAFIDQVTSEIYRRFVRVMVLAGLVTPPRGATIDQLSEAIYIAPAMPWIDPLREVKAYELAEASTHISGPEIIRRQGRNPDEVLRSQQTWRRKLLDAGLREPENNDA